MRRRQLASSAELRAQATAAAGVFTESSVGRARDGDQNAALACQWVGDVNRVVAALWARAEATADPYSQFFALAEQVLTAADHVAAGIDAGRSAPVLIFELRAAFAKACAAADVRLVFPQAPHLTSLRGPVDLAAMRDKILGGSDPQEFVAGRIASAAAFDGEVNALRFALDAYIVDVATRTGDSLLVTAAARLIALNESAPRETATLTDLTSAAKRILGPIEWVRLQPYLSQTAVRAA